MKKIATLTLFCMAAHAELTKENSQQIEVAKAIKPARALEDILNGNVKDLVKPKEKEVGRRLSQYYQQQPNRYQPRQRGFNQQQAMDRYQNQFGYPQFQNQFGPPMGQRGFHAPQRGFQPQMQRYPIRRRSPSSSSSSSYSSSSD